MSPIRFEYERPRKGTLLLWFVAESKGREVEFGPYAVPDEGDMDRAKALASNKLQEDLYDLDHAFFEDHFPTIERGSQGSLRPSVLRCAAILILLVIAPIGTRKPVENYRNTESALAVSMEQDERLYESLSTLANPGDAILARQFRDCRLNGDPKGYPKALIFYHFGLKSPQHADNPAWVAAEKLVRQVGREAIQEAYRSHPLEGFSPEDFEEYLKKEF